MYFVLSCQFSVSFPLSQITTYLNFDKKDCQTKTFYQLTFILSKRKNEESRFAIPDNYSVSLVLGSLQAYYALTMQPFLYIC